MIFSTYCCSSHDNLYLTIKLYIFHFSIQQSNTKGFFAILKRPLHLPLSSLIETAHANSSTTKSGGMKCLSRVKNIPPVNSLKCLTVKTLVPKIPSRPSCCCIR